jgi:hypothetical protein
MTDQIIEISSRYSLLSRERLLLNIEAVNEVNKQNIKGDIVEIGVWKGGSMLSMILANTSPERHFYLYDTFEGMTPPSNHDIDHINNLASNIFNEIKCEASLQEVKNNIKNNTNLDETNIHYIVGDILKNNVYPENIAIFRLDTDFYESTKFELENFYHLVSKGGYIIIDDYGHWKGCKKAVDEFLLIHPEINLIPIDYTGVYFIKS